MAAVLMRARADLRRRWRAWLVLALILGVFGSVPLAAAAGARRTATALERFVSATDSADVQVGNSLSEPLLRAIESLPAVADSGRITFLLVAPERSPGVAGSPSGVTLIVPVDDRWARTFHKPLVVRGRMPRVDAIDEVIINEAIARAQGWSVGTEVVLYGYAPAQLGDIFAGRSPPPSGPRIRVRVTGIGRVARDLSVGSDVEQSGVIVATPQFYRTFGERVGGFGINSMIRLKRGERDVAAFVAEARRLAETVGAPDDELALDAEMDALEAVSQALDVQALALALFALAGTVAVALIVGHAAARRLIFDGDDAQVLAAVGMTRRERFVAGAAPAVMIATIGATVAFVLAAAASWIFPTGFARLAEPDPGLRIDPGTLGVAGLILAVLFLIRVCPVVWWGAGAKASARTATSRTSRIAEAFARAGASVPAVAGIRLAFQGRRGGSATPVRAAAGSAVIGLAAALASIGVATSLDRVVQTPRMYGWNWDVGIAGPDDPSLVPELVSRVKAERSIADSAVTMLADVRVDGRVTQAFGAEQITGNVHPTMIRGRAPVRTDEVALGARTSRELGVAIGDSVELAATRTARARVVGLALFPEGDEDRLDDGIWVSLDTLEGLGVDVDFYDVAARFRRGLDHNAEAARLRTVFGDTNIFLPSRPAVVENVRRVSTVPLALGALVLLMSIATIVHAQVATARRRSMDLAILRTLGSTGKQLRAVLTWQATTFGVVALAVGAPVGLIVGRWAWTIVATRLGVPVEPVVPVAALLLTVPLTFAVLNFTAALPARAAARTQPAIVLRAVD